MPNYDFLNEKTGEIKTLFFHMQDEKKYIDENGNEWKRIWNYAPLYSIDAKLDPNSSKDFVKYTSSRKGKVSDLWDLSAELSQKRAGNSGQDEIKNNMYKEYSNKRKGQLHPHAKKAQSREKLKKFGITVTD